MPRAVRLDNWLYAWTTGCSLFGPEGPADLAWAWRQPVVLGTGTVSWRGSPAGGGVIAAEVTAVTALDAGTGATRWSYTPASTGEGNWQSADATRYYLART